MLLVIIIVVVFIVAIYFVVQNRDIPIKQETTETDLILFNTPYEIYIQHLVDILRDLHLITDKEFDLVTTVYTSVPYNGTDLLPPLIPFETYFSIGKKVCSVTKTEINTDGSISLVLHFTSNSE